MWGLVRRGLFSFDAEAVHEVASDLWALAGLLEPAVAPLLRVRDPVSLLGLTFPNRLGLAAGFDKSARLVRAASLLGFGHLEVGTVTPLPQPGHPRPRVWRVSGRRALRNRMGFPNDGARAFASRLRRPYPIPVGVNLGKGSSTALADAWRDYCASLEVLFPFADYFVVNVSSPNTEGLRSLQHGDLLRRTLSSLHSFHADLAGRHGLPPRPVLVKLSPDLSGSELSSTVDVVLSSPVSGIVACNTTVRRDPPWQREPPAGGLSGEPLTLWAREVVRRLRAKVGPTYPLIGVGGVLSAEDAVALREAGADLVQVYTGLVYGGPLFPRRVAGAMKRSRAPAAP